MAKSCIYYLASESIWSCKKKSLWQSSTPFFKTLGTLTYPWNVVRKPRLFLDCLSELREVPKDSREWSALGYSQGCSGEPPTIKAKDQGCHKTPFYRNTALKRSWAYTVSEDRPHPVFLQSRSRRYLTGPGSIHNKQHSPVFLIPQEWFFSGCHTGRRELLLLVSYFITNANLVH